MTKAAALSILVPRIGSRISRSKYLLELKIGRRFLFPERKRISLEVLYGFGQIQNLNCSFFDLVVSFD